MVVIFGFDYTLDDDEMAALEWWRAVVSRKVERLNAAKGSAERGGNIELARVRRDDIRDEQRLLRAINLACDWLIGRDSLIGKSSPRAPAELWPELHRIDTVLVLGVAPRSLSAWFAE